MVIIPYTKTSIPGTVASSASKHLGIEYAGTIADGPMDEDGPGALVSNPCCLARSPLLIVFPFLLLVFPIALALKGPYSSPPLMSSLKHESNA